VTFAVLAAVPLLTTGYVVYILPQYMLLGVLAMSLAILWGYGGIVSFGQAAFFATGAYAMGLVMKYVTDPGINTAYLGILAGTAGGALMALLIGYFLFSAGVRSTYFVVATLALSIIVEQMVKSFSDITGGWNGLYVDRMTLTLGSLFELSLFDDAPMYYVVLAAVALAYLAVAALMRARFGKIVIGIRENEARRRALRDPCQFRPPVQCERPVLDPGRHLGRHRRAPLASRLLRRRHHRGLALQLPVEHPGDPGLLAARHGPDLHSRHRPVPGRPCRHGLGPRRSAAREEQEPQWPPCLGPMA
jgi:hypothetical protein